MNLQKVFDLQKDLDESFAKNIKDGEKYIETKRIIALLVEIGEFANEVQEFKYWKVHKNINWGNLLEEYADGIHFLSSLCVRNGVSSEIEPLILNDNFSKQLAEVYKASGELFDNLTIETLRYAYSLYLGLGIVAGISETEILESFYRKNKINFKRAEDKY